MILKKWYPEGCIQLSGNNFEGITILETIDNKITDAVQQHITSMDNNKRTAFVSCSFNNFIIELQSLPSPQFANPWSFLEIRLA